jgi:hypothetical protein
MSVLRTYAGIGADAGNCGLDKYTEGTAHVGSGWWRMQIRRNREIDQFIPGSRLSQKETLLCE